MNSTQVSPCGAFTFYECAPSDRRFFLTVSANGPVDNPQNAYDLVYRKILDILRSRQVTVVHERMFGSRSVRDELLRARSAAFQGSELAGNQPFTFVHRDPSWGKGLAGVQILGVRSCDEVFTVQDHARVYGRGWRENGVIYLMLQDLHGEETSHEKDFSKSAQASRMFDRAERILREHGGDYRDVVRTWIYLSNILEWYGEFNTARNDKYTEFGIMPDFKNEDVSPICLPASTGIQGDNCQGSACVMDLFAISGEASVKPKVIQMTNARQKDAFKYRSAFSRGAVIKHRDFTEVQISGTAAIDEKGSTLFPDDFRGQTLRTFENIDSLLAQEDMSMRDISSATAFLKRAEDAVEFERILIERGLKDLPAVRMVADVCRDDLLFEMDGVAVIPGKRV